jgi:hypothetical protein
MKTPSFKEDHISQIPALQLLQNIGHAYLNPEEANLGWGTHTLFAALITNANPPNRETEEPQERGGTDAYICSF